MVNTNTALTRNGKDSNIVNAVTFNRNIFCENIKKLAKAKNMSKEDVEEKCGMYKGFLTKLENSETLEPNIQQLANLSKLFDCPIDSLIRYKVESMGPDMAFLFDLINKLEKDDEWKEIPKNVLTAVKDQPAERVHWIEACDILLPEEDVQNNCDLLDDKLYDLKDKIDNEEYTSQEELENLEKEYSHRKIDIVMYKYKMKEKFEKESGISIDETDHVLKLCDTNYTIPLMVTAGDEITEAYIKTRFHTDPCRIAGNSYYCLVGGAWRIDMLKVDNNGQEDILLYLTSWHTQKIIKLDIRGIEYVDDEHIWADYTPICNTYYREIGERLQHLYKCVFEKIHQPEIPYKVKNIIDRYYW